MKINIKATGIDLTDAIRDYATEKVESVLKFVRIDEENLSANVEVERDRAEINFHLAGKLVRAEAKGDDTYAAIDAAKDELARELSTGKDKHDDLARKGDRELKDRMLGR